MKGRKKVSLFAWICMFVLCITAAAGCGEREGGAESPKEERKIGKELPEDTQWNHGVNAIMETEAGYFVNVAGNTGREPGYQSLRYYDKASGESILLCNKPECAHNGSDSCEATYKNVRPISNALYGNYIYELAAESSGTNVSVNLYKAALDGSSMDKVGCVVSVENEKAQEISLTPSGSASIFNSVNQMPDYGFIIHKGVAYVPYWLQIGKGLMGLKAGLVKMNLSTGETEEIYKVASLASGLPCNLAGVGDYVYFLLSSTNSGGKTRRYVISTKEVESVKMTGKDEKGNVREYEQPFNLFSEDKIYNVSKAYEEKDKLSVAAYDAKTKEWLKEESFQVKITEGSNVKAIFFYEGNLFIGDQEKAWFYDGKGNLLAQVEAPKELIGKELSGIQSDSCYEDYKISGGKLYYLFSDVDEDMVFQTIDEDTYSFMLRRHVFACSLEDVFQGKANWSEVYVSQGR